VSLFAASLAVLSLSIAQHLVSYSGQLVTGSGEPSSNYTVELILESNHTCVERTTSNADGKFEFRNIPSGQYAIEVLDSADRLIGMQDLSNGPVTSTRISILISEPKREKPVNGTVSAVTLQHRPPKKAIQAMNRAIRAANAGDDPTAQTHLRAAIAIDPDFSEAHTNLGATYARAAKYDLANTEFRTALKVGPNSVTGHCNIAVAAMSLNRLDEAEREAREALALDSRHPPANFVLGEILSRRPGKESEAIRYLKLAAPDFVNANLVLAQIYARSGHNQEAIATLEKYEQTNPRADRSQVRKMISSLR
jgi:Tfp pilus assembly protein PilF